MSRRAEITTTLKLETCGYSEQRIQLGRGKQYVSRDGRTHWFAKQKYESLYHQKIKPVCLTWSLAWRRANKKATAQVGIGKKRTRNTTKTQRAIVGLSLEDLAKKKAAAAASKTTGVPSNKKALPSNKKH